MKLKNIIKIGSFVVAGALPTTSQAQVYMCQACPAGTYSDGTQTQCTPCPAGYTSEAGSSSCTLCPAGTYSTGGTKCQACPDYHWSSAGASSCGRIQIGIYFLQFWNPGEKTLTARQLKWYNAGTVFTCNKQQGIGIMDGDEMACGSACPNAPWMKNFPSSGNIYSNYPQCSLFFGGVKNGDPGTSIFLGCKGFPCELSMRTGGTSGMRGVAPDGTKITLNSDGSYYFTDYNGTVRRDKLEVKY